jgi:hypothetical protein
VVAITPVAIVAAVAITLATIAVVVAIIPAAIAAAVVAITPAAIVAVVATIPAAIAAAEATTPAAIAAVVAITPAAIAAVVAITPAITAAAAAIIPEPAALVPIITQVVLGTERPAKAGTLAIIISAPSSKVGSGLASLKLERARIRISFRPMDAIVTPGSNYVSEWPMWHFMMHRSGLSTAESKTSECSHG